MPATLHDLLRAFGLIRTPLDQLPVEPTGVRTTPQGDLSLGAILAGSQIAPERRHPGEYLPGEAGPKDVQASLGSIIEAAGMAAVPGVGPHEIEVRAPARVRPGHEKEFNAWYVAQPRANAFPNGEPLTLYHGTRANFNEFKPHEGAAAGEGIYLAKTPEVANNFAGTGEGARVLPVHASGRFLKMPFNEAINAREWAARARAEGYDGLDTGLGELIVFNPSAIKSAIGNRGTYDRTKGDIRE